MQQVAWSTCTTTVLRDLLQRGEWLCGLQLMLTMSDAWWRLAVVAKPCWHKQTTCASRIRSRHGIRHWCPSQLEIVGTQGFHQKPAIIVIITLSRWSPPRELTFDSQCDTFFSTPCHCARTTYHPGLIEEIFTDHNFRHLGHSPLCSDTQPSCCQMVMKTVMAEPSRVSKQILMVSSFGEGLSHVALSSYTGWLSFRAGRLPEKESFPVACHPPRSIRSSKCSNPSFESCSRSPACCAYDASTGCLSSYFAHGP